MAEGGEVIAAGADEEEGPGQQAVQPLTAHQAGPDDCRLRLREQLDLFAQSDSPVTGGVEDAGAAGSEVGADSASEEVEA